MFHYMMNLSEPLVVEDIELTEEFRWKVYTAERPVAQVQKHILDTIPDSTFVRFDMTSEDIDKIKKQFNWLYPRLRGHIQRLCNENRSVAENLFGLIVVLYYPDPDSVEESEFSLPEIAESEFDGTPWWWSVSPYLMYNLMKDGYPAEIVYKSILEWGESVENWKDPLQGIEEQMELWGVQSLTLPADPNHIVHKYANALSKKVIAEAGAFSKYREDKLKN